jgi:hypothetical protein
MSGDAGVGTSAWLAMLIDGCSVEDLEAFRAERAAEAGSDCGEVESTARQALHLHALLADRQRHARELTVLNDLARQLAAMRRPRDVLAEVAAQTRRLLAVDLAYVMLADEQRVLTMNVVEGSIGSALRGARIPLGAGIGGLVMQSGEPHWTADFLLD